MTCKITLEVVRTGTIPIILKTLVQKTHFSERCINPVYNFSKPTQDLKTIVPFILHT